MSVPHERSVDERGMTTAEYAVGTTGVICFAVALCKVGADPEWLTAIFDRVRWAIAEVLIELNRPWI